MSDIQIAYNQIIEFLGNPNQKVLLLTGIDDDRKPRLAFYAINESKLKTGIVRISNNATEIPRILKMLGMKTPKSKYKYNDPIRFKDKYIIVDNYLNDKSMMYSTRQLDFAIIYPVQTICNREKDRISFIEMLSGLNVKKIIMITSSESFYDYSWLDKMVNKKVTLDSKNDNPEKYEMITKNINQLKKVKDYKDTF